MSLLRLRLDSTAPIQTGSYLPPVFEGRPSSQFTIAPPSEVRRMRKVTQAFFSGMGWLISGVIVFCLQILFWPLAIVGLICFCAGLGYLKKWVLGRLEANSGRVKQANCPSCNRILNFWVTTAFPCPFCKHTLMRQGDNLYDISK